MNIAEPLRQLVIKYLSGPAVDVVPITSMAPVQVQAEIQQKQCDYLLYISIADKKSGGGFLKKMGPLSSAAMMVPGLGAVAGAGMAASMAGMAAGTAMSTAASMGQFVKAKDEVTFAYKLVAPGKTDPILANTAKAKAKSDGDDIITPLIQDAANSILTEVTKKK